MVADGDLRELILNARALLARIQRLSDDHWHVLDATCRAMDDGAWVGPAARRFGAAVHSARAELRGQLAKAVHSAQRRLAALPKGP